MHPSQLHVISVISNPVRYKSRTRLFQDFMNRNQTSGATHWYIEAAFGDRPFEVTNALDPHHIQVRCDHEIWIKENMVNKAVSMLPKDWEYVMWMDGDIEFVRPNWQIEVLEALQHYSVVQPFSHALDMGPNFEGLTEKLATSFAYCLNSGMQFDAKYGPHWHPGYTWAWRRDAWDSVGGMIDLAICGSGDDHMAKGLIGKADRSLPKGLHPNYTHMVKQWEERAVRHIKQNIGHVPGTILHHFHGFKKDRNYWNRWDILKNNQYDPYTDVCKDSQGMLQLVDNGKYGLRDGLRNYFRERKEDLI
jgi:hypothetical protein